MARTCLFVPSAFHPCAVFFECLTFTFYFFLLFYFLFFFLFLMTDGDSMITKNLRDSANGTFVTLDDSSHLTQYEERIERRSQPDKVSQFCMDAGFLRVVEFGQYFMTKDTAEQFLQWPDHHNQEDGFRERRKLHPCWKSRLLACMVNMESRLEFGL